MSVRRAHSSGPQQCISPAPGLACKFVKSTHQGKATATTKSSALAWLRWRRAITRAARQWRGPHCGRAGSGGEGTERDGRAKPEDAIRTLRGLPPPEGSFLRGSDGHGVGGCSWPQCSPQKHNSRIENDGNHAPSQIDERHASRFGNYALCRGHSSKCSSWCR